MADTAFIGLGVMGFNMAGHLACEGHQVRVYNRTQGRVKLWLDEFAGEAALTPREAAEGAEMVMCCVGNDDDLRSVLLGDNGAFAAMKKGSILIDHTTASAQAARELSAIAEQRGIEFLDAPVSGGQSGAEAGMLSIAVGGKQEVYARAAPVLEAYGKLVKHMGPVGSGQLTKMVNQICIAGIVQGLAEGLHFAQAAGLDIAAAMEVIGQGAAQSWQQQNRWQSMSEGRFDFGFAVNWMRKDLNFALDEARRNGAQLPLTALVDQFYSQVQAAGGGRWDTSSLITRLKTTID
ncbi:oxidoreductase [Ventosimonas gracilis]|uniref:Oxidoreductase n=1 Tax=Ventosimonas gracilis TaxID=1680762 RepID=A0A139SJ33_9GAMM|nr:NAD(P)-dependent oxidoreductase [Ventosimonas gracilis]KXU34559.1 oxidoreductase [Ventosimonas gracilis]